MISGKSFLKKTVILGSYIKEDLAQGNCYRRSSLITRSACAIRLVIYSTRLTLIVLEILAYPHVVLVCSLVVLVCPLVLLVVISVGLFITDLVLIRKSKTSSVKFSSVRNEISNKK